MKLRASIVALIAIFVFMACGGVSACPLGGGSHHSSHHHATATRRPFRNNEHVQQWCRNAQVNDPDTWVYRFYDPVTGEEGFIRGRGEAEIWRRLHHAGRVSLHCK